MVGQSDCLEFIDVPDHPKARYLDLSVILHKPDLREGDTYYHTQKQDHGLEQSLDQTQLITLAEPASAGGERVKADSKSATSTAPSAPRSPV